MNINRLSKKMNAFSKCYLRHSNWINELRRTFICAAMNGLKIRQIETHKQIKFNLLGLNCKDEFTRIIIENIVKSCNFFDIFDV